MADWRTQQFLRQHPEITPAQTETLPPDTIDDPDPFGATATGAQQPAPQAAIGAGAPLSVGHEIEDDDPFGTGSQRGAISRFGVGVGRGVISGTGETMKGAAEVGAALPTLQSTAITPYYDAYQKFDTMDPAARMAVRHQIQTDQSLTMLDKTRLQRSLSQREHGAPAEPMEQWAPKPDATQSGLYKAGEAVSGAADNLLPMTDAEKKTFSAQFGQTVGGVVPALAAGVTGSFVGAPEIGLVAGAGQMGAMSAGQQAAEARAKGASPETIAKTALVAGATNAALGAADIGAIMTPVQRASPGIAPWVLAKLQQAARNGLIFTGIGEAQEWISQEIAKNFYDPQAGYSPDVKRALTSLASGSLLGAIAPTRLAEQPDFTARVQPPSEAAAPAAAAPPPQGPPGLAGPAAGPEAAAPAGAQPGAAASPPKQPRQRPARPAAAQPTSGSAADVEAAVAAGQPPAEPAPVPAPAAETPVPPTVPEPVADIHAQIAALADPKNPKDAVFLAPGTPFPGGKLPAIDGLHIASRPEGTLLTTDAAKADLYRNAAAISDPLMAHLLGYPETKPEAIASGNPVVVQGTDASGATVAETLASPQGVPAAEAAIQEQTPKGGDVTVRPPQEVTDERGQETAAEGVQPGGAVGAPSVEESPSQPATPAVAPRLRTVEQIMREDGVGPKVAAATQADEIASIGRPITMDEMAARRAGVAALPSSVPGVPPLQPSEPRDQGYPMFKPSELTIDPAVMQFKTSDEKGVTGALTGFSKWEPMLANPITVWQSNDGRNVIVNGHQRFDLARRAEAAGQQGVQLPARVYREADGYTPEYMRAIGAYQNIGEGSGTPLDAARVLRTKNAFPESMRLPELPPHQQLVVQAKGLANLSPEAFGAVENGLVPPEFAGMVGALISEPAEQMAALDALARGHPANPVEARFMISDIRNSGFLKGAQTTLFGEEAFARSLVPERAKVFGGAMKILRSAAAAFRATVKGEKTLTAAGNVLATGANVEGKTASERLIDTIQRNATTVGPYSDALNVAARELAAGKPLDKAAHAFLQAARELERGGARAGVPAGDHGRGVGHEGEGEQGPIAAEGQNGLLEAIGRLAQPPIKDERQRGMFFETPKTMPKATGALPPRAMIGSAAADFARFAQQNSDVAPKILAARYVLDRGRETGHEYLTAYDPATDSVVMAHTSGASSVVNFPPGFGDIAADPARALVFHHNHPRGMSLSSSDVHQLSLPGVSSVVAYGHDGSFYAASLGPAVVRGENTPSALANGLALGGMRAKTTVSAGMLQAIKNGEATQKELEAVLWDTINRVLHSAGMIDYVASAPRAPHVAAIADRVAAAAIRGGRHVGDHRHPDVASADEGIARVLARSADDSRARRSAGQERGSGGPGLSEGAPRDANGRAQEAGLRGLAERKAPLPPASGAPLFGEAPRQQTPRAAAEPTIRTDERQAVMPGMGPSAVQAQAARDQTGRGGLLPSGEQRPANEGLFAPPKPDQKPLFGRRAGAAPETLQQTPEFKRWFRNSAVVDAAGKPLVVYHGTQRPDRVGDRFRSKRATSGPMAFFTDDPAIASGYAANKSDTSLSNEDSNYETWFRIKPKGARTALPLDRAWWSMSPEQKAKISRLAPRVVYDDDNRIMLAPEGHLTGIGNYDYEIKRAHGNAFKALIEGWLNGGVLFNDEEKFQDVLKAAGVDVPVEMHDPNASQPAIFPVHLSIQRPLDTSAIPQPVVEALDKASRRQRFDPSKGGGDIWDKNNRDPRGWVRELLDDVESGRNTHAWTSIPDWVTKTLRTLGYDGIKDTGGKFGHQDHAVWIPFDDTQVKSAVGNHGTFDPNNPRIQFGRHGQVPLYSAVERAVDGLKQAKGTGEQFAAALAKVPGVKPDEMKWLGLDTWLRGQKTVTKQQIADYVRANQLDVREVKLGPPEPSFEDRYSEEEAARNAFEAMLPETMLDERGQPSSPRGISHYLSIGGMKPEDLSEQYQRAARDYLAARDRTMAASSWGGSGTGDTKFGSYTLPGGQNYREMLITLPPKPNEAAADLPAARREQTEAVASYKQLLEEHGHGDTRTLAARQRWFDAARTVDALTEKAAAEPQPYRTSHWDEPNVLGHIRFSERTAPDGKRVLHIEELQSDWMQAARKRGMKSDFAELFPGYEPRRVGTKWAIYSPRGLDVGGFHDTQEQARDAAIKELQGGAMPDAPFRTTWPALLMKRMIRYAVDNGFDRVAWTPGDEQAKRYDLSKQADRLTWIPSTGHFNASKDGRPLVTKEGVTAAQLPDIIGKDAAQKLIDAPETPGGDEAKTPIKRIEGNDLKAGGAGQRAFYDKMLPIETQKIVGKFGAKVGESKIPVSNLPRAEQQDELLSQFYPEFKPSTTLARVHSFDITPELRHAVMSQGLPLFQRGAMAGHPDYPHPTAIQAVIDAARAMTGNHIQIEAYDAAHHAFMVKFPDGHTEQVFGYAIGRLIRAAIEPGRFAQNMNHEALHALKRLGVFTAKEWSTLEAAAEHGGWIEKHGVRGRYPDLDHIGQVEEAIADEMGERSTAPRVPGATPSLIARMLAKARTFMARLRNLMRGHGFQTVDDVFGKIMRGEVGAREPGSGMEQIGPDTVEGSREAARAWGLRDPNEGALGRGVTPIVAYHGSPHDFDRFDASKIGTGEGAQAYGHGLYFAEREGVARDYRDKLVTDPRDEMNGMIRLASRNATPGRVPSHVTADDARAWFNGANNPTLRALADNEAAVRDFAEIMNEARIGASNSQSALRAYARLDKLLPKAEGRMYKAALHVDPEKMLDWDKPLSQQPPAVLAALRVGDTGIRPDGTVGRFLSPRSPTFGEYYRDLMGASATDAAKRFHEAGIEGIRYLDQGSRAVSALSPEGMAQYFRPGAIVKGYGGNDQVVRLHPGDAARGGYGWSVDVRQVDRDGNPVGPVRNHATEPLPREIAQAEQQRGETFDRPKRTSNYVVFDDKLIDIEAKFGRRGVEPAFARGPVAAPTPATAPPITTPHTMVERLERIPKIGHALAFVGQKFTDLGHTAQMIATPMAAHGASHEARVLAKNYANLTRWIAWDYGKIIDWGRNTFKPDRLTAMWDAADADHVEIQTNGKPLDPGKGGVADLHPDEQTAVKAWQADADKTLALARKVGMTEAEGLPSYAPRMVVDMVEGIAHPFGQGGDNARAEVVRNILTLPLATMRLREAIAGRALVNQIKAAGVRTGQATVVEGGTPQDFRTFGTNLRTTTPQLIHRKHLTTEETEAAANKKRAGMGDQPFTWFTIKGNPAFWTRKARLGTDADGNFGPIRDTDGNVIVDRVPIYVRGDFEGPLKAIMHESGAGPVGRAGEALYHGMMSLKGRMMTSIMYGVAHLGVIAGRAFPAAPNLIRIMRTGNAMKQDPATMRRLVLAGMAPIGRTMGFRDLPGLIEDPQLTPGRSWTSKAIAFVPGLYDPKWSDATKRAIDRAGDFAHNTLLWDQVQNIQVGLALDFEHKLAGAGLDPDTATKVAANFANIYAGALPREAMSQGARAIANVLLFSRSYRLGNLAAVKAALLGLPRDMRSQIIINQGEAVAKFANSLARRKGVSVLVLDMALYYIGNSLLQSGLNAMLGIGQEQDELPEDAGLLRRLGAEGVGYARRVAEEAMRLVQHPQQALNPFGVVESLSALYDHEPQKRNRLLVGFDKDGTGEYMRNPTGKAAEDISDYFVRPLDTMKRMMSPFMRPLQELWANDLGFGHKVYDPMADAPTEVAQTVGALAGSIASSTFPWASRLAGVYSGHETLGRALGEIAAAGLGTSVSKGYPGGPELGELAAASASHQFAVQRAMPGIRDMIRLGKNEEAAAKMTELGVDAGMQRYIFGQTIQPHASRGKIKSFLQYGTPEQQRRVLGPGAP